MRDSAFWRAMDDGDGHWTADTHLLASVCDLLQVANWQRSEDGSKNRNQPKPVARPGEARRADDKAQTIRRMIAERKRMRAIQQRGG